MGRKVLGLAAAKLASSAVFWWSSAALGQPAPEPVVAEGAPSASPPAPQPVVPTPPPATPPPATPPPATDPPPLDPPPPSEPAQRPGFLRTREELEAVKPRVRVAQRARMPDPDFVARSSPWVDFSLTSFYMKDRVSNFLNFGAQVGGYFFDHLRLSARIVAPTEEVRDQSDGFSSFDGGGGPLFRTTRKAPSRSMSLLYGASVGLVVSNDRSFVFGPNIGFVRTDVGDYGTAVLVGLPFEWTTASKMRIGFDFSIGHASGGTTRSTCTQTDSSGLTSSCGMTVNDRQGGTTVVFSYYMGWSLGRL
ncbi:MAG: hypothetical protein K0R38_3353 [Polyangiaceae bacterium]|jgi:hypothetical protein|nr:hypothetical protein [Polyangiaceae bacterium]